MPALVGRVLNSGGVTEIGIMVVVRIAVVMCYLMTPRWRVPDKAKATSRWTVKCRRPA